MSVTIARSPDPVVSAQLAEVPLCQVLPAGNIYGKLPTKRAPIVIHTNRPERFSAGGTSAGEPSFGAFSIGSDALNGFIEHWQDGILICPKLYGVRDE